MDLFKEYLEDGRVNRQTHPYLPLWIYNYTRKTAYDKLWDEVTLLCRGLIVHKETGEIVVKPLLKFYNYEEDVNNGREIPYNTRATLHEKMDGSLGELFYYMGEWIMATRGSFASDQAIEGFKIVKSLFDLDRFDKNLAYICEIIYPTNRIVVKYDEAKISFITITTPEKEWKWEDAKEKIMSFGVDEKYFGEAEYCENFTHEAFLKYKARNLPNKEGYVVLFENGFRTKIKFQDYCNMHRVLTKISSYDVYKDLYVNRRLSEALLDRVPDEFYDWVRKIERELIGRYKALELKHFVVHQKFKHIENQKEFASIIFEYCKTHPKINSKIIFYMRKNSNYSSLIWAKVKPVYEKAFSL